MRPFRLGSVVLALGLLAGCADRAPSGASQATAPALAPASPGDGAASSPRAVAPAADRALRITTETTMSVSDVAGAAAALREAATATGGFVSDARVEGGEEVRNAYLELRIPADRLSDLRQSFAKLGRVLSDSEKAEDVTEQRADLDARLRNARAQEKRLLDLLSDRTGGLADVIAAEKALAEARDTIERLEAQHQLLDGQIRLATVKVHILRDADAAPASATDRVAKAASKGIELAGEAAIGVVVVGATAGPTLAMLAAIGLGLFFAIRTAGRRLGWWGRPRPAAAGYSPGTSIS